MTSSRFALRARRLSMCLLLALTLPHATLSAIDTPLPPTSPLGDLVKKLTEQRAAQATATPTKEQLLRPEFRFNAAHHWLLLPDLARQLTTNDAEREAIFNLLEVGALEARKLLAAEGEGADRDVAVATSLFITQLWGVARQEEPSEAAGDALHAQIAAALAGPEVAQMSDADKQAYWEFCLGFPIFVIGMKEVATDPSSQADLHTIAAAGFESLIGINPLLVDLSLQGMVSRAGLDEAAQQVKADEAAVTERPLLAKTDAGPSVTGITYTSPPGWVRENATWATIFRAKLQDVNSDGSLDPTGRGQHPASIFVLPPRAITKDAHTTFDAIWREQFEAFELGDTIVHYRARIPSGLVIHYMGRFFERKVRNEETLKNYAVLYLVDLGDGRVQPITAIVEPVSPGPGMNSFKESAAFSALWRPLLGLIESVQPADGRAPYPAGGLFSAANLLGDWTTSTRQAGAFYTNTLAGMSAGMATHSSGGAFRLGPDGTYDYSIGFITTNPQFGNTSGSEKHSGRYRLDGDVVLVEPSEPLSYNFTRCAVGIGTRQTSEGMKRILALVSDNNGVFRAPQLMPNWDYYDGVMTWYVEK